jgi:tRNA(fMet)-specific endonuclease VapC
VLYLLDTNAVSDVMSERADLLARLEAVPAEDRVLTCVVVRGEILYGLERLPPGRRRDTLTAKAAEVLALLPCEPVAAMAADDYATMKAERERAGLRLDENDLWIAATAKALGAVLVTRDGDFHGIDGLALENWTT